MLFFNGKLVPSANPCSICFKSPIKVKQFLLHRRHLQARGGKTNSPFTFLCQVTNPFHEHHGNGMHQVPVFGVAVKFSGSPIVIPYGPRKYQ